MIPELFFKSPIRINKHYDTIPHIASKDLIVTYTFRVRINDYKPNDYSRLFGNFCGTEGDDISNNGEKIVATGMFMGSLG